jgi:hypothetical protein
MSASEGIQTSDCRQFRDYRNSRDAATISKACNNGDVDTRSYVYRDDTMEAGRGVLG